MPKEERVDRHRALLLKYLNEPGHPSYAVLFLGLSTPPLLSLLSTVRQYVRPSINFTGLLPYLSHFHSYET